MKTNCGGGDGAAEVATADMTTAVEARLVVVADRSCRRKR